MALLFIHILSFALWLGAACTLPFWGNRMNKADHLHTVLAIIDTVFLIKCVYIMGGLLLTISTGLLLAKNYGFSSDWLKVSGYLSIIIFINSWIIFFFLYFGKKGKRSLMRMVPAIGYTNIFLIILVAYLMVKKPQALLLFYIVSFWIGVIVLGNIINGLIKYQKIRRLATMPPQQYANNYFNLMNSEKMTELLQLFHDEIIFNDPFATRTINGILRLEFFFQSLGDQFDYINILPTKVDCSGNDILITWIANGLTRNGEPLCNLVGTNKMTRIKGKITSVNIEFDLSRLPKLQLIDV